MTIGQRIAQERKALGLSQESLGNQLGVSRQSIYKWESDAAVPEIEKLIALSRLFGVSVGWLLGVEEAPLPDRAEDTGTDPASPRETNPGELTEAQLKMVEQIVERYTAALPNPRRRRWPFVLAGLVVAVVFINLFQSLDSLQLRQEGILNDISRIESSVNGQIGSISNRVEEILKAQNSLVADYEAEIVSVNLQENRIVFSVRAVPKTYTDGMTVQFSIENGTGDVAYAPGESAPDGSFTGTVACALTDTIAISSVFETPDGTRSTQLLEQYGGLYRDSLPSANLMNYGTGELLGLEADPHGRLTLPEVYVTVGPDHTVSAIKEPVGQAELASIRVGLFKNKTLVAWLEPCQQPESFHGEYTDERFFRLPEGTQTALTKESDELCFAAVVADEYGREAIYSDIPYVLENEELGWPSASDISDHDPAHWSY